MVHKTHNPLLSTATDARAVRTREALRRALLELLQVKPWEQITIRDIAAVANIGYTTFFRHHPTKEALLHEIAAAEIRRLLDFAFPVLTDSDDTRAAATALCRYVHAQRELWTILLTGGAAPTLREEFLRLTRQLAVSQPRPSSWLRADIAVILAVSSTLELLAWWLRQKRPLPLENIAEILDRIIIIPIVRGGRNPARDKARTPRKRKRSR